MAGVAQTSRESNLPRITYHATNRTFDRLFRETSLTEMKQVVQRKLGLAGNEVVLLSQIRSGKLIDLDDDDDFDAFRALAHSTASVDVKVTVDVAFSGVQSPPEFNRSLSTPNEESSDQALNGGRKRKVVFPEAETESPHEDMQGTLPPSKRRRANTTSGTKLYTSQPVEPASETRTSQPFQKTGLFTTSTTPSPSTENVRPATLPLPTPAPTQRTVMNQIDGPTPSGTTKPQAKKSKRKVIKSSETVEEEASTQVPNPTQKEGSLTGKKKRKMKKKEAESKSFETAAQASKSIEIEGASQGQFPEELATAISKTGDLVDKEFENSVKSDKPKKLKETKAPSIRESAERANDTDVDLSGPSTTSSGARTLTAKTTTGKTTSKTTKSRGKTDAEAPVDNMDASQSQTPGLRKHRRSATSAELDACVQSIRNLVRQKKQNNTSSAASALVKISAPELPKKAVHPKPVSQKKVTTRKAELESPELNEASQTAPAKGPAQSKTPIVPPSQKRPAPNSDSDDSLKAISLAAKRKYAEHAEESSSKINIQDVLQGPTKRRITIDNALQADIAGQHDTQDVVLEEEQVEATGRSRRFSGACRAASSSDSEMEMGGDTEGDDDPGELDVSSKTPSVPPGIQCVSASSQGVPDPSDNEGPAAKKSSLSASSAPASGRDAETTVLEPFSIVDAAETPQVGKAVAEATEGTTSLGLPQGSGDDVDPIELSITTPREGSPIEPASQIPRNSPVSPVISRMKKRGGKPQDFPTPILVPKPSSRRGRPSKTQPVTSHETAIRDSVVKMTRGRSKLFAANAPITESRKVSAKPTKSDTEEEGQEMTPKARSQKSSGGNSRSESALASPKQPSQATWTALPVSSPTEPDTVSMVDELQSTPGHDVRLEDPLFIPSETQPGFPFSQYQDMETQSVSHSPDDSDDEEEVVQSVTTQSRRPSTVSTFRGLSQIASQPRGQKFGASLLSSQPVRPKPRTTEDLYGKAVMNSDESDSDSDSDAGISHIPKSRRAGKRKA